MEILQILVKCTDGNMYDILALPPEMRAELAQIITKGAEDEAQDETPKNGVILPFGEPRK